MAPLMPRSAGYELQMLRLLRSAKELQCINAITIIITVTHTFVSLKIAAQQQYP
jgi:hypothetical protein